ncbi:MAG: hypothetical protein QOH38_1775 [Thermoleophilaceae bacterium]|nr:hypothetical protein [Thermoleophilaceae bacterium]
MRGRMVLAVGVVCTVGVAAAASATEPLPPRQSGELSFTATRPGAATGTKFAFQFTNPENPDQKPHTVTRIVVHYPAGTKFDSGAAPQCHASDAELQSEGSAACPPESKVGSGLAVSDTGSSGPFPPRYTESTVSQFNGDHELIGVGENKDIPAIKTVTRTKINGTTASTDFPTFPGSPPPDPYTPLKSLKVDFPRRESHGRATTRTPTTCPSVGYWTITTVFTYADDQTGQVVTHSPCGGKPKKPKHHAKYHKHANENRHRGPRHG